MRPDEMFKRRHYGTPQSVMLIISNYTVFAVCASIFATGPKVYWVFWAAMGVLAIYNFFNIRKDREEYTRLRIIAYVISIIAMVLTFILFRSKA